MPNILTIAYSVEGQTDVRFLENIIQRTFEEIAFSCSSEIEVFQAVYIPPPKLGSFKENVVEIAQQAFKTGIKVLCIHADADHENDENVLNYKITPAFAEVNASSSNVCKNLVSIIPVRMSEAWMLADTDLFKEEINTNKSNTVLGIARNPETIADPKTVIEQAIRIAESDKPKKAHNITIGDIYQPLGQKIPLNLLESLASYRKFKANVVAAFKYLNYLH